MWLKGDRPFSHSAVKYSTMPVHLTAFIAPVQQTAIIQRNRINLRRSIEKLSAIVMTRG